MKSVVYKKYTFLLSDEVYEYLQEYDAELAKAFVGDEEKNIDATLSAIILCHKMEREERITGFYDSKGV